MALVLLESEVEIAGVVESPLEGSGPARQPWKVICPTCSQSREEECDAVEVTAARRDGNPIFDLCRDCQIDEWAREPTHLGCCER